MFDKQTPKQEKTETSQPESRLLNELAAERYLLESKSGLKKEDLLKPENAAGAEVFLSGLYDGAINNPVKALHQLAGSKAENESRARNDSTSHKVGEIVGSIVPFIGLSLITKGASKSLLGETATPSIYRIAGEQAGTGLLMGSLLTYSQLKPGESLFESRLKQGGTMAATFATMGATAKFLDGRLAQSGGNILAETTRRVVIGGASGGLGGIVEAEARTGFKADSQELLNSALGYAAFGMLMEGGGTLARTYFMSNKPGIAGLFSRPETNSKQVSAATLLASDTNTSIISSHSGWYDKLARTIYKAPPDHTILVTDPKWLEASKGILRSAKRNDIKVILDEQAAFKQSSAQAPIDAKSEAAKPVMDWAQKARITESVKQEILKTGENPGDALVAALRKNRVVMVGEYHVQDSIHRELGAELMPQLRKAGLTHLAIEHSKDFKGKIFNSDGTLDKARLPELLQHSEFYKLLESAKKQGIEVVPVDGSFKASRELAYRNKIMGEEIGSILENPKSKVLFWVGNRHLHMLDSTGEGAQVAQLLRQRKISVSTFYGQHDNFWREEPLRNMFTPDRALAVPTSSAPTLRSLNWLHPEQTGHNVHKFSEFDYVLVYPKQLPAHWD